MNKVEFNWGNILFRARRDAYFDTDTYATLNGLPPNHDYASAYFIGVLDGHERGDICCITEFDWILKSTGKILNSNIPFIENAIQHDNYIIEDQDTGIKYDWFNNKIIDRIC